MLQAFIPADAHKAVVAVIMSIVDTYTPGDLDTEFRVIEALGEAGVWPATILEDAEPGMPLAA